MPILRRLLPVALCLLAACGGSDPSAPSSGSLAVAIDGLPAGASADVTVSGPGGYSHVSESSETLTNLTPGVYSVSAEPVSSNGESFAPSQSYQSVTVEESSAAAVAQVTYGTAGAMLEVDITGLPTGVAASVTVSGPDGYERVLTVSTTLAGLQPGVYSLAAQSVSDGSAQYDPSPAFQTANLVTGDSASAAVGYTQASSAGFNLRIDGLYLTQSVQTYGRAVPLVSGRDGYLRVFVTATQANVAAPMVRVRLAVGGVTTQDTLLTANGLSVPLTPNEGTLSSSWNMPVPGALIQPTLTVLAEVDPNGAVTETNEADNAFPATGIPLPLDVRPASTFSVRFVPILQSLNGLQGDVTNANKASYLDATMQVHPLSGFDADLRAPYVTNGAVVKAETSTEWSRILSELRSARTADGSSRYYYGVVKPTYTSGIAGIGYIGVPVAIGWDKPGKDGVAAHEWGHNWGREHSPCGSASDPDPNYPYANGAIGVYGFDVAARTVKPPTSSDLMGYCNNEWISDYTYTGVMNFRAAHADVAGDFAQAMQPCLLVWGRMVDGRPVLEPAFQVVTRPSLPAASGPYTVEGQADDGSSLFRIAFAPDAVADDPGAGAQFSFAIPLQPDKAERLATMRLRAPGRAPVIRRALTSARAGTPPVTASRVAGGRIGLRWDAASHPMVMVRDAATGQVLSFARGGVSDVVADGGALDLQVSDGVRSRSLRVTVPR